MQTSTRGTALAAAGIVTFSAALAPAIAPASAATGGDAPPARNAPAVGTALQRPAMSRLAKREVGGRRLAGRGIIVSYPGPRARRLPDVPASAYVIADAGTGKVLAAKDPHGLFPPASTLKVLTAITMLPRLRPNATVVATKRAAYVEPNIVGLVPGHRYKVADLFRALLLISANDAAVALVQASGSFDKGMALMNAQARHLRAYDVVAKQPNGLPAAGQVVSAYDLALIARKALSMPAFMRYDRTLTARFPVTRHRKVWLANQNYLLTQYHGGLGGKIGWTTAAGATYIGLARRHGVTLIVTILHAIPQTEITSAEQLLNWGFAMDGRVHPVGVLVRPRPARPRLQSRTSRTVALGNSVKGAGTGSGDGAFAAGIGVAAGLCAAVLAGLLWLRRRSAPSRAPR